MNTLQKLHTFSFGADQRPSNFGSFCADRSFKKNCKWTSNGTGW